MNKPIAAAYAAITCAMSATPASAEIFWSNFDVTNAPATQVRNLLPLNHRTPAQSFDNGAVTVGVWSQWNQAQFEFTVGSTFTASNAIIAVNRSFGYGDQRIGFHFEHFNTATGAWEGFGTDNGFFQLNGGNLPYGTVREAELPFGTNYTGGYGGYSFRPITFVAGETYRVGASHWAGGGGYLDWMLSDVATDRAFYGIGRGVYSTGQLAYQPTLALTDGGELVGPLAGVPELSTWAMLVLGFGVAGGAMRSRTRRRFAVA